MKVVRKLSYIYVVIAVLTGSQKCVTVLLQTPTYDGNVPSRFLIVSAWFPFDKQEHYWVDYINVAKLVISVYFVESLLHPNIPYDNRSLVSGLYGHFYV